MTPRGDVVTTLATQLSTTPRETLEAYAASGCDPSVLAPIIERQEAEVAHLPSVTWADHTLSCIGPDVPFLLDSILICLRKRGFATGQILHPVIDGVSRISMTLSPDPSDEDLEAVRARIAEVHAVVEAWEPMVTLVKGTIRGLDPRGQLLVDWLCRDAFLLLGAARGDVRLGLAEQFPEIVDGAPTTSELRHTKSTFRSPIHRDVFLDVFTAGDVTFFGLLTAETYSSSVTATPLASARASAIFEASGLPRRSHSGNDLEQVLEAFPRDVLMLAPLDALTRDILSISSNTTRVFLYPDIFPGATSSVVVIPREKFTAHLVAKLSAVVTEAFGSAAVDTQISVSSGPLAYLSLTAEGGADAADLTARLREAAIDWETAYLAANGPAASLADFDVSYRASNSPAEAVADAAELAALDGPGIRARLVAGSSEAHRRIRIYSLQRISLSRLLPILSNFGLEVTDEKPYTCGNSWLYDVGVTARDPLWWAPERHEVFMDTLLAAWEGTTEPDSLDQLSLSGSLTWHDITVLRAILAYMRQAGTHFSRQYLRDCLTRNIDIVVELVAYFNSRFDPERASEAAAAEHRATAASLIAAVPSLDDERITTSILTVMDAIVRTSAFLDKPTVAFKLRPREIPFLPEPRPLFEIWVYSPQVEGVHLRFGPVARGGLRWSDRAEDFRTEILGLVKAQMVKNAVIVPTGSKGGFFAKQLPPAENRDEWLAAGTDAYRLFVSSLLDLTDTIEAGAVKPPAGVVRYDGDDPYLVVAADKGTAKFSDIANGVSRAYDFWLDDAFASGGSAGFDHKGMGITARGAWESVKHHFRTLGINCQEEDFTAIGIGDMSGDVFGNGMLLSRHTRLVAAFDHRSIFIDPQPNADASYEERKRLFELPRSSWEDYDAAVLSEGGGVWSRGVKSIDVTPAIREALGWENAPEHATPDEVIRAILGAPVDLLWNGGIGTYVKASDETNDEIGDPSNNSIRVNGSELRCRVVGEGGNLGFSQRGRIEAALAGTLINTDAIDNSAGVDTSDHEVNLKILLAGPVASGELTIEDRDALLEQVTDEVGLQVLRDNYHQNVLLDVERSMSAQRTQEHIRLMHWLETHGGLNRQLEFLPSDEELVARGTGLTSPELAVLVAYTKIVIKEDLGSSDVTRDPLFADRLATYFPAAVTERCGEYVPQHRLASDIVVTIVANALVNHGGLTFALRAMEDTGASLGEVTKAFAVAQALIDHSGFVSAVEELDNSVPTETQNALYLRAIDILEDLVRRIILDGYDGEAARIACEPAEVTWPGVPADIVERIAVMAAVPLEVEARTLAAQSGFDLATVRTRLTEVNEAFGFDGLVAKAAALPQTSVWDAMARSAMTSDVRGLASRFTRLLLDLDVNAQDWIEQHHEAAELVASARRASGDLASLTVTLRAFRMLAA